MKTAHLATMLGMTLSLAVAPPGWAHHSFAAEFDLAKPITLHGTAVKWEMINPHSYLTLDVKNADGSVTRWSVEMGAPSALYRNGWRKDSVKVGDELTIDGYKARDGSNTIFGAQAKLADGTRVLGGAPRTLSAEPPSPPPDDKRPNP
jgi:Family of unknown function (DUF6152)